MTEQTARVRLKCHKCKRSVVIIRDTYKGAYCQGNGAVRHALTPMCP